MPTRRRTKTGFSPRKTASQARARDTVAAILESAARIAETQGLDAANTNAIAEKAGVSVGSLYQYFPGKDAIFAELLVEAENKAVSALTRAFQSSGGKPFSGIVRALLKAAIAQQFERPELARALDYFESRLPHGARNTAADDAIVALLSGLLEDYRNEHSARPFDTAAHDLLALVKGMVDGASERGEGNTDDLERRVFAAVSGYLGISCSRQESV